MPKIIDLTGQKFGRLTAVSATLGSDGRKDWFCRCDCGGEKTVPSIRLRTGKTQSCGCLRAEVARATADARSVAEARRKDPLYHRWASMIQRCHNPANPSFKNYGARGIFVCDRWREDFGNFFADMGAPPSGQHTIERIDNDGAYEPENCRWALRADQLRNQRRSIVIEIAGRSLPAKDWAAELGISYQAITKRYRQGGTAAATEFVRAAVQ